MFFEESIFLKYLCSKRLFIHIKSLFAWEMREGSRGEEQEEKQREEGLTSQQETGTIDSPARIWHVALTNITCAMPPQRRACSTDRETHLHDT